MLSEFGGEINIGWRSTHNKISQSTKQRTAIPSRNIRENANTHLGRSEQISPPPIALNGLSKLKHTLSNGLETTCYPP